MSDEITRQTAGMVAAALGNGWAADTSEAFDGYPGVYLDGPDGARVYLRRDWRNADRLEISGCYPDGSRDVYPTPERHEIGVRRDRGPDVIGREITRRLLPAYLPELERVRARLAEMARARYTQGNVAAEMIATYPSGRISAGREPGRLNLSDSRDGGWYGDIDLYHDGSRASLNLRSLPAGLALEVLRLLEGWQQ